MKQLIAIVLFIAMAALINAEKQHHEHNHKKDHLGFFGSRGKRSAGDDGISTTSNTLSDSDGDENTLKHWSTLHDSFMGLQRNIRAPKGFFGMRGKKDYDMKEEEKRALFGSPAMQALRERNRFYEDTSYPDYQDFLPKRAPSQGFFGMRGKKFSDYDLGGNLNDKRAPIGFMGMRGKKSSPNKFDNDIDESQAQALDYNSLYEKRAPSGFMGMRGKKTLFE